MRYFNTENQRNTLPETQEHSQYPEAPDEDFRASKREDDDQESANRKARTRERDLSSFAGLSLGNPHKVYQ